ncbi:helix-turn-helix domain-containing protein [Halostella litorea]|uniref:helix-turn-helix domain-containing protein n=1 Tax=Halostella litorea TaxID=2528831 RepID=UPI0010920EB3|nr:helix-turn-helix domain-containing protein [Halostella litorea]
MATRTREHDDSLPGELDSPCAKLVYLYLSTRGEATVERLRKELDLEKITLFSILDTLASRGLVREECGTYRPA